MHLHVVLCRQFTQHIIISSTYGTTEVRNFFPFYMVNQWSKCEKVWPDTLLWKILLICTLILPPFVVTVNYRCTDINNTVL